MKMTMQALRRAATWWAVSAASVVLVACGGGGGSPGTPIVGGGTGGGVTPSTVSDLKLVLDKDSVVNTGTESVTLTVTSVDASGTVVGNVPVKFSVDNGGVIAPSGTATDKTAGTLTATIGLGEDQTNRKITVTATSGSITKSKTINVVDSVSGGQVADLAMVLDKASIANDGSQVITLTVTTLDATRSALGGSPVSFKVTDSGDAYVSTNGVTTTSTSSGQLVATVKLASDQTNRTISVTAKSGTVQRTVSFAVVDPVLTVPRASDITLLLDRTNVGNSGGDVVKVTVTAVDALRNVITGIPVTISADNNATVSPSGKTTDATGKVTADVLIGADKSNRLITVTAKSDTLVRTATFSVNGAAIQSTALPALPIAGSRGTIEYLVSDVNKNPMAGVPITISGPGITGGTGTTGANGEYVFTYVAPSTPGPLDITAVAAGRTSVQTVTVSSGTSTVPTASPTVTTTSLAASPSVVRVNTATDKSNRTEIRALFQGANNTPVKNVRVRFDLNGDANSIGGTLAAGSNIVYSDAQGVAITNYSPGERSSPTNGLTVRACWDYADFSQGSCPNQVLATLTVVADPLSITIGTDNTASEGADKLTYTKKYILLVVDSAGQPKSDVQLTPSLDLDRFAKGFYTWNAVDQVWEQTFTVTCAAEDTNRNGLMEAGEDRNGSGELDPRKSDVSISMIGSTKTNASGTAIVQIEYPKNLGSWVHFKISVSAAGVLSPPAIWTDYLPVLAGDLKSKVPPPAFVNSKYGQSNSCLDTQ